MLTKAVRMLLSPILCNPYKCATLLHKLLLTLPHFIQSYRQYIYVSVEVLAHYFYQFKWERAVTNSLSPALLLETSELPLFYYSKATTSAGNLEKAKSRVSWVEPRLVSTP